MTKRDTLILIVTISLSIVAMTLVNCRTGFEVMGVWP